MMNDHKHIIQTMLPQIAYSFPEENNVSSVSIVAGRVCDNREKMALPIVRAISNRGGPNKPGWKCQHRTRAPKLNKRKLHLSSYDDDDGDGDPAWCLFECLPTSYMCLPVLCSFTAIAFVFYASAGMPPTKMPHILSRLFLFSCRLVGIVSPLLSAFVRPNWTVSHNGSSGYGNTRSEQTRLAAWTTLLYRYTQSVRYTSGWNGWQAPMVLIPKCKIVSRHRSCYCSQCVVEILWILSERASGNADCKFLCVYLKGCRTNWRCFLYLSEEQCCSSSFRLT